MATKTKSKSVEKVAIDQSESLPVEIAETVEPELAMSFEVDQKELLKVLALCGRSLDKKATHPILHCFKFEVDSKGQTLWISAFDLSVSIKSRIAISIAGDFPDLEICVTGTLLKELIAKLSGQIVFNFYSALALEVRSDSGSYKIPCLPSEAFPELPQPDAEFFDIDGESLQELLSASFCASKDETKQQLCGVHLAIADNTAKSYATDGFRLVRVRLTLPRSCSPIACTIPSDGVAILSQLCSGDDVAIAASDCSLFAKTSDTEISTRLLEGQYPKIDQLIPNQFASKVSVDSKRLASASERLSLFCSATAMRKFIQLLFGDVLELTVAKGDRGTGGETIAIEPSEIPMSIGLPAPQILEAIGFLGSESIVFQMNSSTSPVVLIPAAERESDRLCLIAPQLV